MNGKIISTRKFGKIRNIDFDLKYLQFIDFKIRIRVHAIQRANFNAKVGNSLLRDVLDDARTED